MTSVKEIQSVRNACVLLEEIARSQPVGVSELSRATGVDKSATHRLAVTLNSAGWLDRAADGRWQVAPGLVALIRESARASLVRGARGLLEAARDQSGETAMLVVPDGGRLVIADVAESAHNLRVSVTVGSQMPARHSSALRAIASRLSEEELVPWRRVDPDLTEETLEAVRRRGWGLNDGEVVDDTRAVGAPLLDPQGRPLGAIVIVGPASRSDQAQMSARGELVSELALGWRHG